jgi:rhomboid protease GluP
MCPNCRAFVTTSDKVCPYCEAQIGPRAVDQRTPGEILGGLIPHAQFTTIMILLINTALYAAEMISPQAGIGRLGASIPASNMDGEWWRLITAGFLHGGIMHILMNSWALFVLGSQVEELYGTSRFMVFYFTATVAGFWASSHFSLAYYTVGASAGIFGLLGALMAFGLTDKTSLGSMVKASYTQTLIYCVVISFLPGVSLSAHAGGFAGGFAAAWLARTPRARLMWKEWLLKVLASVCLAATLLAFGMLYLAISRGS